MPTAIIYGRVSTVRQADDGLPIDSQVQQAKAKAEALDAQVLQVFLDEGISGRSSKRAAFQAAINFCSITKVDYFICWSTSRFARNKIDAASYKLMLKRWGTKVIYVSCEIDSETDEGWFYESVIEIVDEQYSRTISKDTRRSMLKNAQDGFFNGGRIPFGYCAVSAGRRKKLQVMPSEALVVREIFRLYIGGFGTKEIAMQLNQQGIQRRGMRWEKNIIASLLKNQVYTGHVVFNRKSADGIARPGDQWIVTKGHECVVSAEDFASAQKLAAARSPVKGGSSPHSQFVFTGILRCGACDAGLQIESATGRSALYHYYNCRSAQKGRGCSNRRIPAGELDTWLTDKLLDRLFTFERMAELVREVRELKGVQEKSRQEKLAALEAELRIVERKQNKLFELLETHGRDTPNLGDLTRRLRAYKSQIEVLEKGIIAIDMQSAPQIPVSESEVRDATNVFRGIIKDGTDPKKLRLFFASFIKRVTVYDDRVHCEYDPERLVQRTGYDSIPLIRKGSGEWLPDDGLLRTAILALNLPEKLCRRAA